ncbi:hypothetical protein [uncultured Bartonella sp.]|nr:hypothetical protein [uncultured Bartonella sp.]
MAQNHSLHVTQKGQSVLDLKKRLLALFFVNAGKMMAFAIGNNRYA